MEGWNARRAAHLAAAAANSSAGGSGSGLSRSAVPHEVALNHFADWTREEWLALVKPDRRVGGAPSAHAGGMTA